MCSKLCPWNSHMCALWVYNYHELDVKCKTEWERYVISISGDVNISIVYVGVIGVWRIECPWMDQTLMHQYLYVPCKCNFSWDWTACSRFNWWDLSIGNLDSSTVRTGVSSHALSNITIDIFDVYIPNTVCIDIDIISIWGDIIYVNMS